MTTKEKRRVFLRIAQVGPSKFRAQLVEPDSKPVGDRVYYASRECFTAARADTLAKAFLERHRDLLVLIHPEPEPTLAETKQAVADLGVRTAKRALRQSAKAVALHAQPGAALYEGDALSAQAVLARGAPVAVVDGEAARTISANATQAKLELYPELIELLREIEGAGLIAYTDCAKTARALLTRHSMIEAGES